MLEELEAEVVLFLSDDEEPWPPSDNEAWTVVDSAVAEDDVEDGGENSDGLGLLVEVCWKNAKRELIFAKIGKREILSSQVNDKKNL